MTLTTVRDLHYQLPLHCPALQVHRFLGLTVGLIQAAMDPDLRKRAYDMDITYVTNSEIGFDYLRDNLAIRTNELVQVTFQTIGPQAAEQ